MNASNAKAPSVDGQGSEIPTSGSKYHFVHNFQNEIKLDYL